MSLELLMIGRYGYMLFNLKPKLLHFCTHFGMLTMTHFCYFLPAPERNTPFMGWSWKIGQKNIAVDHHTAVFLARGIL